MANETVFVDSVIGREYSGLFQWGFGSIFIVATLGSLNAMMVSRHGRIQSEESKSTKNKWSDSEWINFYHAIASASFATFNLVGCTGLYDLDSFKTMLIGSSCGSIGYGACFQADTLVIRSLKKIGSGTLKDNRLELNLKKIQFYLIIIPTFLVGAVCTVLVLAGVLTNISVIWRAQLISFLIPIQTLIWTTLVFGKQAKGTIEFLIKGATKEQQKTEYQRVLRKIDRTVKGLSLICGATSVMIVPLAAFPLFDVAPVTYALTMIQFQIVEAAWLILSFLVWRPTAKKRNATFAKFFSFSSPKTDAAKTSSRVACARKYEQQSGTENTSNMSGGKVAPVESC